MEAMFIGEISMFAGNFAPRNWAFCDGSLLAVSQYAALFSILGTTYGGDGRTTFGLPNLKGRVPIHEGTGPGLSTFRLGQVGGAEYITLNTAVMPAHTHAVGATLNFRNEVGDETSPSDGSLAVATGTNQIYHADGPTSSTFNSGTITGSASNVGSNSPYSNRGPFVAVNYIICLAGTYPSRS
ncbi:MAG: tail fiber protein [Bacteroidota bacterium]